MQAPRKAKAGEIIRFSYNHPVVDANTGGREKYILVLNPNYRGKLHGIDLARLTDAERKVLKAILDPMNIVAPAAKAPVNQVLPTPDKVAPAKPPPGTVKTLHGKATNMSQMSPEKKAEMLALYGSPAQKAQAKDIKWAQHQSLVKDVLKRMNPLQEIKNPVVFYVKFVRQFLHGKDAYRQYWPNLMLNVTIEKKSDVTGKVINPKPLFKKPEAKHPFSMSAFAKAPGSPEEVIRQARMAAAKKERERIEKARAASKAQYQAKKAGLGKIVKPSVTKPPRNK